jgi:hypothetical protein
MEKTINVHVPEGYAGTPIEVVLREGRANDIKDPKKYNATGLAIAGIGAYVGGRAFAATPQENLVIVEYCLDPENSFIHFIGHENDPNATDLMAKLEKCQDLIDFKINSDYFFTQNELERLVKKHAHCFADPSQAQQFLSNLRNFEVRYEQMVKKEDDRKGNTLAHEENAIKFAKGSIELKWDLKMPLFEGTEAKSFTVELEIEKGKNNMPTFGFYSMEIELMLKQEAFDLINDAVDKLKSQFVCIQKI